MKFLKRVMFYAGVYLGKPLVHTLFKLNKSVTQNEDIVTETLKSGKSGVICLWHGRFLFPLHFFRSNRFHIVIGLHDDAEVLARVALKMNYGTIRGSSSRGGSEAYRRMVKILSTSGTMVIITPDGPKGPPGKVKSGTVRGAKAAEAVIIPMSGQATRKWEIKSWDTVVVPKPFGKVSVVFGEPLVMTKNSNIEESCRILENELNRVQDLADAAATEKA